MFYSLSMGLTLYDYFGGHYFIYPSVRCRGGVNLQQGMNFRLRGGHSVILMSLREDAPYAGKYNGGKKSYCLVWVIELFNTEGCRPNSPLAEQGHLDAQSTDSKPTQDL